MQNVLCDSVALSCLVGSPYNPLSVEWIHVGGSLPLVNSFMLKRTTQYTSLLGLSDDPHRSIGRTCGIAGSRVAGEGRCQRGGALRVHGNRDADHRHACAGIVCIHS